MHYYFVGTLFIAWILSLFGFDELFIKGIKELFDKDISVASYYIIFLGLGLFFDLVGFLRRR